jgi:hypothetical protein
MKLAARSFEALQAAGMKKLREVTATARPGRSLHTMAVMPIAEALLDPVIGAYILEALAATFRAATGVSSKMGECFTCSARWQVEGPCRPAAVARLQMGEPSFEVLGFLCPSCVQGDLEALMLATVKKDFLADVQVVTPADLAPVAGHA